MLKHFNRSICYTSLNHGCWSISVVMKHVACTETFILKRILITWLKTCYHTFCWESNTKKKVLMFFSPECSYVAFRRNSAKFNSSLFWFAFASMYLWLSYAIVLKAVVLISVITHLHVACVPHGNTFQIAIL